MRHLNILSIVLLSTLSLTLSAQSISGNVKAFESETDLGYANVDIYKGIELIASVLADKEGNFNVKLDTGTYRAEIIYAGYKKITQEIHVQEDEKVAISLQVDSESIFSKPNEDSPAYDKGDASYYSIDEEVYYDSDISEEKDKTIRVTSGYAPMLSKKEMGIVRGDYKGPQQGVAGRLTAGEINDFSKWKLWTDLKADELSEYQKEWNYSPSKRYMVQLIDESGLPLADITVHLKKKDGTKLYTARTDNTGKAELWKSLLFEQQEAKEKLIIEVLFSGNKFTIKNAKSFEDGMNRLTLEAACNQSQKVDIAFVVDATGSMSDELNYLTAELNDVIFKSKEISSTLNFSFANVFYRDHGDAYLTRKQDFTRILSESVSFIGGQSAGGGGDFEEAVEVALDTAVNALSWSPYARARILFLILDAPPHNTPEIQEKLNRISLQAAAKGIRIVPLVASGINKGTEYLMRSIALATNGTYAFLTDDSGIGGGHLKPSTDSYEVETLNDLLVRVIKSYTYMPDCEQTLPELDLNYPSDTVVYSPLDTTKVDSSTMSPIKPIEVT